jgi:hypothetical protein
MKWLLDPSVPPLVTLIAGVFGLLFAELIRRFRVMRDESRRLRGRLRSKS